MLHNSLDFSNLTLNPHWSERREFNSLCSTSGSSQNYSRIIPNFSWHPPEVSPGLLSQTSFEIIWEFPQDCPKFPFRSTRSFPRIIPISLEIILKFPQDYPRFPITAQKQGAPAPRGALAFLGCGADPRGPCSRRVSWPARGSRASASSPPLPARRWCPNPEGNRTGTGNGAPAPTSWYGVGTPG